MTQGGQRTWEAELVIGSVRVRPRERIVETPTACVTVEPLVMQVLVALARRAGQLVTRREIFEKCWGGVSVGDDSLNRIVAALRKALQRAAADLMTVETVAGTGYVLRLVPRTGEQGIPGQNEDEVHRAIAAAFDSWRSGLPEPDHLRLELLRRACALQPDKALAHGMLALLCRLAAEYAEPGAASAYVAECEASARRALALDSHQPDALTALASVEPLLGRWLDARERLMAIRAVHGKHPAATHDLAIVEMATGRVRAAKELMDCLLAADPLAPCYCYKSIYQHWSIGDLVGMDQVADRAIQLWPTHPAVWLARFWTLAYTQRTKAAMNMLADAAVRPDLPPLALGFMRQALLAVAGNAEERTASVVASIKLAGSGPAQAIACLFTAGLLQSPDAIFEIAEAYYFRSGNVPVPMRHTAHELSVNDQHRRVTQVLFTPVFAGVRDDPRFRSLCHRAGLSSYWEATGLRPDFQRLAQNPKAAVVHQTANSEQTISSQGARP
jgi:DNA-binding winged helix-turn-helix (wHTH) protein